MHNRYGHDWVTSDVGIGMSVGLYRILCRQIPMHTAFAPIPDFWRILRGKSLNPGTAWALCTTGQAFCWWAALTVAPPHHSPPSLFSSFLPVFSLCTLSRCFHPLLPLKNLKAEVLEHCLSDVPTIWIYDSLSQSVVPTVKGRRLLPVHRPLPTISWSHPVPPSWDLTSWFSLSLLHGHHSIVLYTCSSSQSFTGVQISYIFNSSPLIPGLWVVHFLPRQVAWQINLPVFLPPMYSIHSLHSLPLFHDLTVLSKLTEGLKMIKPGDIFRSFFWTSLHR